MSERWRGPRPMRSRTPIGLLAVILVASGCAFAGSGPSGAPPSSVASGEATTPPGGTIVSTAPPTAPAASQDAVSTSQDPAVASPDTAAASPRPMPECEYLDEPVLGDPGSDWSTLVLDTVFTLPADFAPAKLVSTRRAGLNGGYQVSRVVVDDLKAMADAARADGLPLAVQSAYRSYAYQVTTYQGWVDRSSEAEARTVSARPGHSEHQLGTALDLRSADDATPPWQLADFAATDTGAWLEQHAWEYGFVMSYPKGRKKQTCYAYEPWHYRYVGRDVAAAIHESGQVPRRYLWETYWADQ